MFENDFCSLKPPLFLLLFFFFLPLQHPVVLQLLNCFQLYILCIIKIDGAWCGISMKVGCWKSNFPSAPLKDLFNLSLNRLGSADFHRNNLFFCQNLGWLARSPIDLLAGTWDAANPKVLQPLACVPGAGEALWLQLPFVAGRWRVLFSFLCCAYKGRHRGCHCISSASALPVCFGHVLFTCPCSLDRDRSDPWAALLGTGWCEEHPGSGFALLTFEFLGRMLPKLRTPSELNVLIHNSLCMKILCLPGWEKKADNSGSLGT